MIPVLLLTSGVSVRGDVTPPIVAPSVPMGSLFVLDPATGAAIAVQTSDPAVLDKLAANAMLLADTLRKEIAARATTPAPEKPALRVVTTEGRS